MPQIIDLPSVYLLGESKTNLNEIERYLMDIGNPKWRPDTNISDAENLIIFAGKACYRSWEPFDPTKPNATNPNVSSVREDPRQYILNILKSGHGSVLEHASATFMFQNVTRVFTHEVCRHRAGCAISQESLRFVRLDHIRYWGPYSLTRPETIFKKELENGDIIIDQCKQALEIIEMQISTCEQTQSKLAKIFNIDNMKNFTLKKKLTSMFRRVAPIGLSTCIVFSMNMRALRHIIGMRSTPHAEEEIQLVFNKVGKIAKEKWPLIFQDMHQREDGTWEFEYPKI